MALARELNARCIFYILKERGYKVQGGRGEGMQNVAGEMQLSSRSGDQEREVDGSLWL